MPSIDLTELSIDRFGSYDKLKLPLKDLGAVYINGPIGSGKSTIPFAVYYLLVGKMIRKKSEFVSVKDFANKIFKDGYEAALKFTVDDYQCLVKEIRDRGSDKEMARDGLYFFVDGEDRRGKTDQDTRNEINKFIGVSEDLSNLSFLSRRQVQKLIGGTSADRAKVVVDVFGLERYNRMIESCSNEVSELEITRRSFNGKIESQQLLIDSLGKDLSSFDELDGEVDESQIDRISARIKEIEVKLKKIGEKEKEASEFITRAEEINKHREKLSVLNGEIENLERQIEKLPDDCDDAAKDELKERLDEKTELLSEIKSSKRELEQIRKLGNLCPVNKEECPIDVPQKHKSVRVKECKKLIKTKGSLLESLDSSIKSLKIEVETVEDRERLKESVDGKLKLRDSLDVDEISEDELEERNVLLKKCLSGKERGEHKLEELREECSDLQTKAKLIEQRKKDMSSLRESLEKTKTKLSKNRKSLEEFDILIQYTNGALNVFKKAKIYKIRLVLDFLNDSVNKVLHEISDGKRSIELVSQRKTKKSKAAMDKLGVMVSDSYKTLPVELVSDGQETQVGIAMLFGVWKTANDLSNKKVCFLWLDEVFGPLDDEAVEKVFDAVARLSREMGTNSIFIISHRNLDCRLFNLEWCTKSVGGISELLINQLN